MIRNKKKIWFTLIEIIMVLAVVSILMLSLKNFFQIKNKDQYYWQVCVNNIYGQISNFIYQWITSKSIRSWQDLISPEKYSINFDYEQNWIFLNYTTQDWLTWYKNILFLSWNELKKYYCKSETYNIFFTWLVGLNIEFVRWLQEKNANLDVFKIRDENMIEYITWGIVFLQCDKQNFICKNLWEFIFDKRNHSVVNKVCLIWSNTWSCEEWDQ